MAHWEVIALVSGNIEAVSGPAAPDRPGAQEWIVWQGAAADKAEALQSAEKADPRGDLEWMRIRHERDLNTRISLGPLQSFASPSRRNPIAEFVRKGLRFLGQKRERGTASGSPSQVFVVFAVAASAGRCQGAHRKSGVVIRLSYACQAESYLLP